MPLDMILDEFIQWKLPFWKISLDVLSAEGDSRPRGSGKPSAILIIEKKPKQRPTHLGDNTAQRPIAELN